MDGKTKMCTNMVLFQIIHDWGELDHDVPVSDNTSCRLAVCNMDWDRVTASDLLGMGRFIELPEVHGYKHLLTK